MKIPSSMSKRRYQYLNCQPVVLIILWGALMNAHVYLLLSMNTTDIPSGHKLANYNDIFFYLQYCLIFLSFPLFGLLADVKTGRYMTIITGVYFSFMSWIVSGLTLIADLYFHLKPLYLSLLSLSSFLQFIGYCSVHSNIIQYNIDQTVGASADVLSTIIYWHFIGRPLINFFIGIGQCLIKDIKFLIVTYVLSGMAVSTVIVSNFFFKHWLDTTHYNINPVKVIAKVLNYARKNKYPRNRSALTYWEENYPSRLDLGKEKYGGPFSEEQVENVKTVLRLIPLLICIVGVHLFDDVKWTSYFSHVTTERDSTFSCSLSKNMVTNLVTAVFLFLYQLIIYRCCCKYISSMLKRVGLGLAFAVSTPISQLILSITKNHVNTDTIQYVIPQFLSAISYILIVPTYTEFIVAQSPQEMRGFMIGLSYTATGLGLAINYISEYTFSSCEGELYCQNIYFHLLKGLIVFIIFIVFLILAKRYKLRVRENEVNIHLITEEHYERYMEQEEKYKKEIGLQK